MESNFGVPQMVFMPIVLVHFVSFIVVLKRAGYSRMNVFNPFIWFTLAGVSRTAFACMFIPFVNFGVFIFTFYHIGLRFGISKRMAAVLAVSLFGLFPYIALRNLEYSQLRT